MRSIGSAGDNDFNLLSIVTLTRRRGATGSFNADSKRCT